MNIASIYGIRSVVPLIGFTGVRLARTLCWALTLSALPLQASYPTPADSREYQIKAAFLYNFTRFVEWPEEAFQDESSPIVIGVLGRNPFGDELAESVHNRRAGGRQLEVLFIDVLDDTETGAHLLFVPAGEEKQATGHLDSLHQHHTLTVGESPKFEDTQGIITFTLEADRIRFRINRDSADDAGLRISAQLLQLAQTRR